MNPKQKLAMLLLLAQLKRDYTLIPGIKKLIGKQHAFRIRLGGYRIIFIVHADRTVEIVRVTKRDEGTYKNL